MAIIKKNMAYILLLTLPLFIFFQNCSKNKSNSEDLNSSLVANDQRVSINAPVANAKDIQAALDAKNAMLRIRIAALDLPAQSKNKLCSNKNFLARCQLETRQYVRAGELIHFKLSLLDNLNKSCLIGPAKTNYSYALDNYGQITDNPNQPNLAGIFSLPAGGKARIVFKGTEPDGSSMNAQQAPLAVQQNGNWIIEIPAASSTGLYKRYAEIYDIDGQLLCTTNNVNTVLLPGDLSTPPSNNESGCLANDFAVSINSKANLKICSNYKTSTCSKNNTTTNCGAIVGGYYELNDSKYFGSAHSLLGGNIHFNKLMNGTDSCASGRSLISKSIKEGLSVYYETECQGIDVTNAAAIVPKSPTAAPTNSSSVNPVVSAPVAQEPSKILIGYTLAGRKVYEIVQSNIFRRAYGAKLIYDQEVSGMTEIQWSWLNDPRFEKKKAAKIAEFIERVKLLEVQYPGYTKAALSNPTMIDSIRGQVWDEILAEGSYEFLNSMGFKMATSSNYNETISTQPQIKGYWNPVKETIICADAMPTYNNDYSTTCAIGAAKKQYSGGYANDLIPDQKKCIDQGLKYFSVILELKCIPDLTVAN